MRSLKYHPDRKGGSTAAFQRVASAFQTLSDPNKRAAYDQVPRPKNWLVRTLPPLCLHAFQGHFVIALARVASTGGGYQDAQPA